MDFDEHGWATTRVEPLAVQEAFSLLSPDPSAQVDAARWAHAAESFFRAKVALSRPKLYPAGTVPRMDGLKLTVGRVGEPSVTSVEVITVPLDRAPLVRRAALEAAQAMGGAGFDVLVLRARRLWQVRAAVECGDPRAPLLAAGVLASVLLAPILEKGGRAIFGVKGAKERLRAEGWL